eukprot:COSAG01_NODE_3578_length_5914_cov_2.371625_2_plen_284_part_00
MPAHHQRTYATHGMDASSRVPRWREGGCALPRSLSLSLAPQLRRVRRQAAVEDDEVRPLGPLRPPPRITPRRALAQPLDAAGEAGEARLKRHARTSGRHARQRSRRRCARGGAGWACHTAPARASDASESALTCSAASLAADTPLTGNTCMPSSASSSSSSEEDSSSLERMAWWLRSGSLVRRLETSPGEGPSAGTSPPLCIGAPPHRTPNGSRTQELRARAQTQRVTHAYTHTYTSARAHTLLLQQWIAMAALGSCGGGGGGGGGGAWRAGRPLQTHREPSA